MPPNITILPLAHTNADCTAWAAMHIACLAGPTSDLIYGPGGINPETFSWIVQRRLEEMVAPGVTVLKAVDESGRMVGMVKWTLCERNDDEDGKQVDGKGESGGGREAAVRLSTIAPTAAAPNGLRISFPVISALMTPLREACDEIMAPHAVYVKLNQLYVLPEMQRQGIGSQLLGCCVAAAEELGVPMYLDSLHEATRLYERRGWVVVRDVTFEREPFGGEGREVYYVSSFGGWLNSLRDVADWVSV